MPKNPRDAVIVAYGRTPMARAGKGAFADMHPVEYGAQALRGVIDRLPGLDPARIDDVIVGCATPEKYFGFNVARFLVQRAGLPDAVPAQTVNRLCSSGLQTIAIAANAIKADEMDVVVAGGIERMTGIFIGLPDEYQDGALIEQRPDVYISMGLTAENVAAQYGITRADMEELAAESHRKAYEARIAGKFQEEIVPIEVKTEQGIVTVTEDEGIRPGTTAAALSELRRTGGTYGLVTVCIGGGMGAAGILAMER